MDDAVRTPTPAETLKCARALQDARGALRAADSAWARVERAAWALVFKGAPITGRPSNHRLGPVTLVTSGADARVHGPLLCVTVERYCGEGNYDRVQPILFPLAWLDMPEAAWKPKLEAAHAEGVERKRLAAERRTAIQRCAVETQERELMATLQAKYSVSAGSDGR